MTSAVITTINRPKLVLQCLQSALSCAGIFEIIVIHQGEEDVKYPEDNRLRVIHCEKCGLSAARNRGIQYAKGDIVAFIDDDAVLEPDYFNIIEKIFSDKNISGIAGRILVGETGKPYAKTHRDKLEDLSILRWNRFLGGNMVFRKCVFGQVGLFDERFGVGTEWAAAEETDIFFRLNYCGLKMMYDPKLIVYHPAEAGSDKSKASLNCKLYSYGKGHGACFAKHVIQFKRPIMNLLFLWELIKPVLRVIQCILLFRGGHISKYVAIYNGKLAGYFDFLRTYAKTI